MTSISYSFELLIGYAIFGLIFGLLGLILEPLTPATSLGPVQTLAVYLWRGSIVVYLVFGAFYFWRQIRTWMILR